MAELTRAVERALELGGADADAVRLILEHQDARTARKTYRFSEDWRVHEAMIYFTLYRYNFSWVVRTLRQRDGHSRWQRRTPAMAAGLSDYIWSLREWIAFPAVQVA